MSEYTGAHQAALEGVAQERPEDVSAAWDRLEQRYGYELASLAWRAACAELDHAAECDDGCDKCAA